MSKCLHPETAWICGKRYSKDGVLSPHLVFSANEAIAYYNKIGCPNLIDENTISVPCGKCYACQVEKRKHWSTRLSHEASMHSEACFVTLTYNDEHIPTTDWQPLRDENKQFDRGAGTLPEYTLVPADVQLFIKRLRRHLEYQPKKRSTVSYRGCLINRDHCRIRYFAAGEYGSKTHRPHYHILIFGWKPSDLKLLKLYKGRPVYTSEQIENCWTMRDSDGVKRKIGFCSISDVNPFVARYVARYVTKKMQHLEDGSDKYVVPEFNLQSVRNGGIGAPWFDRFGEREILNRFVTYRCGDRIIKASVPPYYMHRLRLTNQPLFVKLQNQKLEFAKSHKLTVEEACQRYEETVAFVNAEKDKSRHFAQQERF